MTSPPEDIEVRCPNCGQVYEDWWRPSINFALDSFDEEYLDRASSSVCPSCGYKVRHEALVVDEDGVFNEGSPEEDGDEDPS